MWIPNLLKRFSRWLVHRWISVSMGTPTIRLKWVYTNCLFSLAITSCTFLMSSTAIWLLGLGILAWRFFFFSSRESSFFWLGMKSIWLYTTTSADGMLSNNDTMSTGMETLFTSMFVNGRTREGMLMQSTSTRLYILHLLSPMVIASSSTLKLFIDKFLSVKFIEK